LWFAYGGVLLAVTLAGVEILAWAITPSWPSYLLRPAPVSHDAVARWHAGMPEVTYVTNSWLMRDRERTVARPPGIAFRSVFIGDSFLEGGFTRAALPARIEGRWGETGIEDAEAINLGVAGTGPIEYHYRIREVGLKLTPDAIVLMFYSGNDVIAERFQENRELPFVAELPRPSLLARVAPHLTWQVVNALRLSGAAQGGKYAPDEQAIIADALRQPPAQGLPILAKLMHRHYFPELEENRIAEILGRGGDRFWSEFRPRRFDREHLQGWILDGLIALEVSTKNLPMSPAEADATVAPGPIDATLSWLAATDRLVRSSGAKFLVALIPPADGDPDFVEFLRPWPRFFSYTLERGALHRAMAAAMAKTAIPFVDLQHDLRGVRGSYRKTDLHWTELGHEVVAERLARVVRELKR